MAGCNQGFEGIKKAPPDGGADSGVFDEIIDTSEDTEKTADDNQTTDTDNGKDAETTE